jgi:orotate phosphoribosyltransferase
MELSDLVPVRAGHYAFESGHHGDLWLDLDALFLWPAKVRPHATVLSGQLAGYRPDAICGPLTGGAFLAQMVAEDLGAAFLPRVPTSLRERIRGWRVAIVDDAINAGSAIRSCYDALRSAGAEPVAVGALIDLGHHEKASLGLPLHTLTTMRAHLWSPRDCPLCREQIPLSQ